MKTIRWQMVMEGRPSPSTPFRNAADVYAAARSLGLHERDREHFVVFLLDTKHRPIAAETVSIGILDGSLVHPREVFKAAVAASAAGIIAVHNHPSGEVEPSPEDHEVTKRLKAAGGILGIPVVDHLIVADGSFYSFRDSAPGSW